MIQIKEFDIFLDEKDVLGEGKTGIAYKAKRKTDNKDFAAKTLKKEYNNDDDRKQAFKREFKIQ